MKTFRTLRLVTLGAALLAVGATAVAAQPPARRPQGEARRPLPQRAPRLDRGPQARQQLRRTLFRDIDLTVEQQRRIRDIGFRYSDQREDLARSLRQRAGVTAGQRPDSAARTRLRTELQTQNRTLLERQLGELRGVLTNEQRTAFDRNVTRFRERMQADSGRARGARAVGASRRERVLREQALRGRGLRGDALRAPALRDRALRDRALRDRAFRAPALRDRALLERGLRERALRDRMLRERARLRDRDVRRYE